MCGFSPSNDASPTNKAQLEKLTAPELNYGHRLQGVAFFDGKSGIWEKLTTDKTSLSIFTAEETFRLLKGDDVAVIRGWRAALRQDPRTAKMTISVKADGGKVVLSGVIEGGLSAADAIQIASAVEGVQHVTSELRETAGAASRYKRDA